MTNTKVGTNVDTNANGKTTQTITTVNVGDLVVLVTQVSSTTIFFSSMSSTRITWTTVGHVFGPSPMAMGLSLFMGIVNSVGSDTITGTPSAAIGVVNSQWTAAQYHTDSGLPWAIDNAQFATAQNGSAGTTLTMPALTSGGSDRVAAGVMVPEGTGTAGTTTGYTYIRDGYTSLYAYHLAITSGAITPATATMTSGRFVSAGALFVPLATVSAPAGNAAGTGTANNATVTTAAGGIPAELASGTGSAGAPKPSVAPHAELATAGTGAAGAPKPNVGAKAGLASGTGVAQTATDTTDSFVPAGLASGTGVAQVATASTEDPVGVPFLLAQIAGAQLAVEVAWGADLAADEATWVWTDISDFVRYAPAINLKHGRADEAAKSQPATAKLTLDNSGGDFSRGGQGPNWPYVRLNTPVRVSVDPGDTAYQTIYLGFADAWQPAWDTTGTNATVELSASGILRRLAQGTSALVSPFRRAMLARTDIVAYWPCEEPKRSQTISSGLTGQTAMVLSGTAEYPYPKFGESEAFPCSQSLPEVNQTTWRGAVPAYTSTNAVQLRFLAAAPADPFNGTECIIASLFTGGSLARWDVSYANGSGGTLGVYVTDTAGTRTLLGAGFVGFNVDDTVRWYSLEIAQDGADVDWSLRTIGLGYRSAGATSGTVLTDTITRATAVAIGPDGDVGELVVGHVTVQKAITTFTSDLDSFNSFDYELVTDRLARLCDEAGVAITITGTSTLRMGPQVANELVPLLRECELADGGLLYDGLANGLSYVTGTQRVNAAAGLTLDAATGQIGNPEPIDDDQRIRNKVTAKRSAGGEATYEDVTGELGTTAVGVYDDSIEVNTAYPDDLIDHASRQVALGTVPGYRYPHLNLAIHHDPDLIDDWLAIAPSTRIDVTGIDDVRTQHPAGTVTSLLEGYTQRLDQYLWDIALNLSPYEPFRAGTYADTTGSDEFTQRLDTAGATLNTSASAGATSLSVATSAGPLWVRTSQVPDEFPFDIEVGGIRVTVTACSGSSSPQTFTVTGSTVTRALPSGATVSLWHPVALGM